MKVLYLKCLQWLLRGSKALKGSRNKTKILRNIYWALLTSWVEAFSGFPLSVKLNTSSSAPHWASSQVWVPATLTCSRTCSQLLYQHIFSQAVSLNVLFPADSLSLTFEMSLILTGLFKDLTLRSLTWFSQPDAIYCSFLIFNAYCIYSCIPLIKYWCPCLILSLCL